MVNAGRVEQIEAEDQAAKRRRVEPSFRGRGGTFRGGRRGGGPQGFRQVRFQEQRKFEERQEHRPAKPVHQEQRRKKKPVTEKGQFQLKG